MQSLQYVRTEVMFGWATGDTHSHSTHYTQQRRHAPPTYPSPPPSSHKSHHSHCPQEKDQQLPWSYEHDKRCCLYFYIISWGHVCYGIFGNSTSQTQHPQPCKASTQPPRHTCSLTAQREGDSMGVYQVPWSNTTYTHSRDSHSEHRTHSR